jgi:hypothetical protein
MAEPQPKQVIDRSEIDALIDRLERGELRNGDLARVVELLKLLVRLADECASHRVSLRRLQKMLFGPTSERRPRPDADSAIEASAADSVVQASTDATSAEPRQKAKRKGHGRTPTSRYTGAERVTCNDELLAPGRPCPACFGRGRLFDTNEPSIFLQFTVSLRPAGLTGVETCCGELVHGEALRAVW